jgi:hypothetical protein
MSVLQERLTQIEDEINRLQGEAREALKAAPVTDEHLDATIKWFGHRDRYVLVQPDGNVYYGIPGMSFVSTTFTQRPAAMRAASSRPGCRVYDTRESRFLEADRG